MLNVVAKQVTARDERFRLVKLVLWSSMFHISQRCMLFKAIKAALDAG